MKDKEVNYLTAYRLGDFFDKPFKMVKHTFKSSMRLFLLIMVPALVVYSASIVLYFNSFAVVFKKLSSGDIPDFTDVMPPPLVVLLFIVGTIIYMLGFYFSSACIALKAYKQAHGEDTPINEILTEVYRERLVPILGQLLLKGLIFGAILFIPITLSIMLPFIFKGVPLLALLMGFVGFFIIIAAYVVFFWLVYAFNFSTEAIVIDGTGAVEGLKRSFYLVKGNWWRVFGILLLISMIISFIVSTVTSPMIMLTILPDLSRFMEAMMHSSGYDSMEILFEFYAGMFANMTIPLIISTVIQTAVYMIIYPVLQALFYIDLKFRKGEIAQRAENQAVTEEGLQ